MSHSVGSIKQNMPTPENLTALHARMLLEIFGVREEKRRPPVVSCMGRGYDIIHDEIKVSIVIKNGIFICGETTQDNQCIVLGWELEREMRKFSS